MPQLSPPRALTHIGLTVTDIDAACEWYADVFGWYVSSPPGEVAAGPDGWGPTVADVFGPRFGRVRIAHLATGNGVAVELFEFGEPETERREDPFEYWKSGFSHICIVDPDIEGLAGRIEAAGGRIRTRFWTLYEGRPYRMVYCEDPFGTILELHTHSHELTYSNQ